MEREKISDSCIGWATGNIMSMLEFRIEEKGLGSLVSLNELHGMVDQEVWKLKKALHERDELSIISELHDLAVACIFAIACLRNETVDGFRNE